MSPVEYPDIKTLYEQCKYVTFSTVNEDGSPHGSPMFFIPSADAKKLYMGTHPQSLHAQNMLRTGQAFATIYGRLPDGMRGLYFRLINCREAVGAELDEALKCHNIARAKISKPPLEKQFYETPNSQRMIICDVAEITTNDVTLRQDGRIDIDFRTEITM